MRLPTGGLPGKLVGQARLLRQDPERFARNLLQYTNPALFRDRMIDIIGNVPMHVSISDTGQAAPRLNVLDGAWTKTGMTGGPNTVINLACRVARAGVPVRFIGTRQTDMLDAAWFRAHAESLVGDAGFPQTPLLSAARPEAPLELGPGDVFLATHWSTAQQLKAILPRMQRRRFFYMLQEFEPGFYAWSSNYALALETFGMDFWPVINEATLAEFLFAQPYGELADPAMRARALVFEPAIDRALFHPGAAAPSGRPRRLLFYARPNNTRNLFGLGLMALRAAAADPVFAGWEFLSIGSQGSVPAMDLGHGHTLQPAPWTNYAGYGDVLRGADVLLCPMLSPHTSYPVLEMAACGGLAVTNSFATKTAESFARLSTNIITTAPTAEGLQAGLVQAAEAVAAGRARDGSIALPASWDEALGPVAEAIAGVLAAA